MMCELLATSLITFMGQQPLLKDDASKPISFPSQGR